MNGVSACLDRLDLAGGLFIHYHEHIIELLLVAMVYLYLWNFLLYPVIILLSIHKRGSTDSYAIHIDHMCFEIPPQIGYSYVDNK